MKVRLQLGPSGIERRLQRITLEKSILPLLVELRNALFERADLSRTVSCTGSLLLNLVYTGAVQPNFQRSLQPKR